MEHLKQTALHTLKKTIFLCVCQKTLCAFDTLSVFNSIVLTDFLYFFGLFTFVHIAFLFTWYELS